MAFPDINPPSPLTGMSSVPVSNPGMGGENPGMGGGGVEGAKQVFRVVQSLKALASSFPNHSKDIDEIIEKVERIGLSVMSSSGSQGQPTAVPNSGSVEGTF